MSDRPIRHDGDTDVEIPAPAWLVGSTMRLTREQLAAAERTRDYHLRRMQSAFMRDEPVEAAANRDS
jgi:hypothetical protein